MAALSFIVTTHQMLVANDTIVNSAALLEHIRSEFPEDQTIPIRTANHRRLEKADRGANAA